MGSLTVRSRNSKRTLTGLNLQAWRIPLWGCYILYGVISSFGSQPPSLENPFVGHVAENAQKASRFCLSQPPSLENPFVGTPTHQNATVPPSLNLQAWRIPLWVLLFFFVHGVTHLSQPPSLENPFVGDAIIGVLRGALTSQPPSLENPFVGNQPQPETLRLILSLNLQAWRIPLWVEHNGAIAVCLELVSTSKPGESRCGLDHAVVFLEVGAGVSTSKPGESLCGR